MAQKSNRGGKNQGKRGRRQGLSKQQVRKIKKNLRRKRAFDDLVIFSVALSTLLRESDLLLLKGHHVMFCDRYIRPTTLKERILFKIFGQKSLFHKVIKEHFTITQKKTQYPVTVFLNKPTQKILYEYILTHNIEETSYLFTMRKDKAMSAGSYRKLIKRLVSTIGLNPERYSGHTTRRTTAMALYEQTKNIELVRRALGHRSIQATIAYLGIETKDVEDEIMKIE